MKLTKNFSLDEFTKSQTAVRKGIPNVPNTAQRLRIIDLCIDVLQPLRDSLGRSININSGFRCEKLNKAIGGSGKSQHCKGEAADIEMSGIDNFELADHIHDTLDFDQLILEFYDEHIPGSGWVHVSYKRGKNRKQVLQANKVGRKTVYSPLELF